MSRWAAAVPLGIGVLIGLLAAGVLLLVSKPQRGEAIRLSPPPSPPPLVVQVGGAVANPGVYELSPGSRIDDAIQAAGGARPQAVLDGVNLAALLEDGAQVYVLSENETPPAGTTGGLLSRSEEGIWLVNINTATQAELEKLPGIGPTRARSIIAYRQEQGLFREIDELMHVEGIGEGIFEEIKELITVK